MVSISGNAVLVQRNRLRARYVVRLAWFGLFLVLLISAFSYYSSNVYRLSSQWRIHSEEVISLTNEIQSLIERAETAQRGYVLTSSDVFLEPYASSVQSAQALTKDIVTLVSDNPEQEARAKAIDELLLHKVETMQKPIDLVKKNQSKAAIDVIREGTGQSLMTELRDRFAEFKRDENKLLIERTDLSESSFNQANVISLLGMLASVAVLSAVTILLQREIRQRTRIAERLVVAESKANEASAMKSQFLANMSHEIRTPLNGVIGMTRLLSATKLTAEQDSLLKPLQDSANFLLSLINQVLDLSKIESGKLQLEEIHFELRSLVESTVSMLDDAASAKGLQLSMEFDEEVSDLYLGDPLRIRQILLNLISNAIKFSTKGTIKIRVLHLEEGESTSRLRFEIQDQGMGMDDQTRARLFQAFSQGDESTTRKFGGTGLGLSITKQLVELMSGKISVSSSSGVGSTFSFDLLLKLAKYSAEQVAALHSNEAPQLGARVLVAEDNLINQKVISAMLKMMGCTYVIASNGQEAINKLSKEKFDLVLMDGQMPIVDGYEASRQIREGKAGEDNCLIPIIAVTANAIKGDTERCLAAGMNDYIPKPISQSDLQLKMAKWLKASAGSVDLQMLKNLKEMESEDHPNLVHEVIEMFLSSVAPTIKGFRKAHDKADYESIRREAHSFKSSCGSVGAIKMAEISNRLEKLGSEDTLEMFEDLLYALQTDFLQVEKILRGYK